MLGRETSQAWRQRWVDGQTGWDQGQRHPELQSLLEHALLEGGLKDKALIYSAGCGRAHNEAWLAREGYDVIATDFVAEAIDAAQGLYGTETRLQLLVEDACEVKAEQKGRFQAVFDRAMLCALQPENRLAYVEATKERLAENGLFMAILFRSVRRESGPPFAVDERTAFSLLGDAFDLCYASSTVAALQPDAVTDEWVCIWKKRG